MSATIALRFPTEAELDAAWTAMHSTFGAVERVVWPVARIVDQWEDETTVADRPTHETVGMLAEWVHYAEGVQAEIARELERMKELLPSVMEIRGHDDDA